jgi:choline dehydrogenase
MQFLNFIASLTSIYVSFGTISAQQNSYDYIVVGAGPTGSMVATELARKGYSTLLIDAGKDYMHPNITVPAFQFNTLGTEQIQWDYWVKHYDESTGLRQKVLYPKASGLGGCTLHNSLIHVYPNSRDFKEMVELTGDKSWAETTFRKYLEAISLYRLGSSDRRWLPLSNLNVFRILDLDLKLLGLAKLILGPFFHSITGFDPNGYAGRGKINTDFETDFLPKSNVDELSTGVPFRRGIAEYLKTRRNDPKLTIWTETLVTKVILDGKKATGVEFAKGAHLYRASPIARRENKPLPNLESVFARKEVIISAGTFNSPQLAMLSGIGHKDELAAVGIESKVHLPGVGKNLHDRYEISVNFEFDSDLKLLDGCLFKADRKADPCYAKYLDYGTGPYSVAGYLSAKSLKSNPSLPEPDMVHFNFPLNFTGYHPGTPAQAADSHRTFTFLNLKAHGFNRAGVLRLESNDPRDTPYINFRYFEQGADKDIPAIIKGIKDIRKTMAKTRLRYKEVRPGSQVTSDAALEDYIRKTSWGHHATGTMKIGRDNDPNAVLDGNFKVRGVENLRVIDLSVMPNLPGYFPVMFLYLLGMKGADVIAP